MEEREPAPTLPEDAEASDQEGAGDGQSRGAASAEPRAPRARTRRRPPGGATRGRKLHLPDEVHDRLWLLARQRRQSVSAIAAEILDRALPRFRVEREG